MSQIKKILTILYSIDLLVVAILALFNHQGVALKFILTAYLLVIFSAALFLWRPDEKR